MKRFFRFFFLPAVLILAVGCGGHKGQTGQTDDAVQDSLETSDNGMIYGLACEGSSDTAVWFLPLDASNPIVYDITKAMHRHKIFGKIKTGDAIAVLVNIEDSTVADVVIDLDQLKGTWCYVEMPVLKNADKMPEGAARQVIASLPDSIRETYYQPVEYGFTLKRNDVAQPLTLTRNTQGDDEENPFTYKEDAKYTAWHIYNGRLVLTEQVNRRIIMEEDSLESDDKEEPPVRVEATTVNDTVEIAFLGEDSLAIKFADRTQGYYRKK